MNTPAIIRHHPAKDVPALPEPDARTAWRRRVATVGSQFQLAFAALWLARGTLATSWPARPLIAVLLVAGAAGLSAWGAIATRGLAPQPRGPQAERLGRSITIATVAQLVVSCALPFAVGALGRPDLMVPVIAVTTGMLLLWLRAKVGSAGHLIAGILLIVVPVALALALAGNALTATAGLATAAILAGGAWTGFRWLAATRRVANVPAPGR